MVEAVRVGATARRRRPALSDELGDRVRVIIARLLRLLRLRLLRPLGRRVDDLWPLRRQHRRVFERELWRGRRLGSRGRRRLGFGRRRRLRLGRRRRLRFRRRRGRRLFGGAEIRRRLRRRRRRRRRRGLRLLLAVGDLVEFAQRDRFNRDRFRTVRESRSRSETEQDQGQAARHAARWSPPDSNMTAVRPTAPGYRLIGSVTRATFLNPADVTVAMISATRP